MESSNLETPLSEEVQKLRQEDEVSFKSTLSTLLDHVEPEESQKKPVKVVESNKVLLESKREVIFEELLYISQLKDNSSQVNEKKIFLESELEEIGKFQLSVVESEGHYSVNAESKMLREGAKFEIGYWASGKYDHHCKLICEKRTEYDFVDNERMEKTLDVRQIEHKIIVERSTKINNNTKYVKATINMKKRNEAFILNGGALLLIRYLVISKMIGDLSYISMTMAGKSICCQLNLREECSEIKVFHRTFKNVVHVRNTQYFKNQPQEISDTFYTVSGRMILHYWHNFNYILHETKGFSCKGEHIMPQLEFNWCNHEQLLQQYRLKREQIYESAKEYIANHPELSNLLHDFILSVLKYKPRNIFEFSAKFFQKFQANSEGF